MAVKHLTTKEFHNLVIDPTETNPVFKGERPAIVDFFATW